MPQLTNNWNTGTNNFLKNYVYFRINPNEQITQYIPAKTFTNIVTKLTSAFWHGFYPAYYLFFLGAWLVNECDDMLRNTFEKFTIVKDEQGNIVSYKYPLRYLYIVISWISIMIPLNYLGNAFQLLRADWCLTFWSQLYWYGQLLPITLIIVSKAVKRVTREKRVPNQIKKQL
jgi:hypothetical protein